MRATSPEAERRPPLVVVVGPTGAGKTELGIRIAERAQTEIVSADSQQVYVGMDIGTAKPTAEETGRVRHHLIDVARPQEKMTAARFVELADAAIAEIAGRRSGQGQVRGVVVAGGTGLYVRALLIGLFEGPPADPELRERLEREAALTGGAPALWQRLRDVDPDSAARIEPNDLIRITRALEVYELTGAPMSEHHRAHDHRSAPLRYRTRIVGLAPERDLLYRRIDERVDAMMAAGLLAEVEALRARGCGPELGSQAAIGYAELHRYFDGQIPLAEAVRLIKRNSRRYARRQLSWYRNDPLVEWYQDGADIDLDDLGRYLGG